MARLITDGAEMGDTLAWLAPSNLSAATTPAPVAGAYSYYFNRFTSGAYPFPALSELYLRARVYYPGTGCSLALRSASAAAHLAVSYDAALERLGVTCGALSGFTPAGSLKPFTWRRLELYYKLDAADGLLELRLDGFTRLSLSGDTRHGLAAAVDNLFVSGDYQSVYLDDLALNDTSGEADNGWPGEGRVIALAPAGEGAASEWGGSDGGALDNYLLVNELPHDGDASYVEAGAPGARDLYSLAAYSGAGQAVQRAWVELRARAASGSGEQVKALLRTGGTLYASPALELGAAYARLLSPAWAANPSSGEPWTAEDLNALQAGVEAA